MEQKLQRKCNSTIFTYNEENTDVSLTKYNTRDTSVIENIAFLNSSLLVVNISKGMRLETPHSKSRVYDKSEPARGRCHPERAQTVHGGGTVSEYANESTQYSLHIDSKSGKQAPTGSC